MRGETAKIVLLLTGLLMLSLSVLPHHHHGGTTHFHSQQTCTNCACPHGQTPVREVSCTSHPDASACNPAQPTHATNCDHHGDAGQDCSIKQLFVTFAREDNTPNASDRTLLDNCHHLQPAITLFYFYTSHLWVGETRKLPEPPYIEHTYTVTVGKTLTLRAPPAHIA